MSRGFIILDSVYPGFPGDVRNGSTHPFSIQYGLLKTRTPNAVTLPVFSKGLSAVQTDLALQSW
jgi:hypothetical protein